MTNRAEPDLTALLVYLKFSVMMLLKGRMNAATLYVLTLAESFYTQV